MNKSATYSQSHAQSTFLLMILASRVPPTHVDKSGEKVPFSPKLTHNRTAS